MDGCQRYLGGANNDRLRRSRKRAKQANFQVSGMNGRVGGASHLPLKRALGEKQS